MKTSDGDRIYEVLGFHDGAWVWYGSDDVTLPQEVYDRLAQGSRVSSRLENRSTG